MVTRTDHPGQDLDVERAYLAHARDCLARMREATERLNAQGGDAFAGEQLERWIATRLLALRDDPDLPLFFGRIDMTPAGGGETFHIGRRHVHDDRREPVVVDWRADVSRAFYQATWRDPLGVSRRRRFGLRGGSITALEDEALDAGEHAEGLSPLVAREIERPRTGPMRDIVATIQPDQDDLVRAGLDERICVQGGPGTGKTAVGLHRVAFLLYAHTEQLRRRGVLVIGPNEAFLGYIAQVLPALGEFDVEQRRLQDVVRSVKVRREDGPGVGRLKHDPRMAAVIARAVAAHLRPIEAALAVRISHRTVRLETRRLSRIRADAVARGLPHEPGRQIFHQRVADELLRTAEGMAIELTRADVRSALRDPAARQALDAAWPRLKPAEVVFGLLTDPGRLSAAAEGLLTPEEQAALVWTGTVSRTRAPWSVADLLLVDEAAGCIDRPRSFGHLVVDEAQDRSPMELRAVGRRAQGGVTLLGDLSQATAPWASRTWEEAFGHLGLPGTRIAYLTTAFRIPASVLRLANRLLPHLGVAVPEPVAVRDSADALTVRRVAADSVAEEVARAAARASTHEGSTGVIVPGPLLDPCARALRDAGLEWKGIDAVAAGGVTLLRATDAKGLEFDDVVVAEPAAIHEEDPAAGLGTLYVALTRAVMRLTVIHARDMPLLRLR
jgi:DNA helicase IV